MFNFVDCTALCCSCQSCSNRLAPTRLTEQILCACKWYFVLSPSRCYSLSLFLFLRFWIIVFVFSSCVLTYMIFFQLASARHLACLISVRVSRLVSHLVMPRLTTERLVSFRLVSHICVCVSETTMNMYVYAVWMYIHNARTCPFIYVTMCCCIDCCVCALIWCGVAPWECDWAKKGRSSCFRRAPRKGGGTWIDSYWGRVVMVHCYVWEWLRVSYRYE
jgi:hypothetical protein